MTKYLLFSVLIIVAIAFLVSCQSKKLASADAQSEEKTLTTKNMSKTTKNTDDLDPSDEKKDVTMDLDNSDNEEVVKESADQKIATPMTDPSGSIKTVEKTREDKGDTEKPENSFASKNSGLESTGDDVQGVKGDGKTKGSKGPTSKTSSNAGGENTKDSKLQITGDKIVFGSGGGFTGATTTYVLSKSGQLLRQDANEMLFQLKAFKSLDVENYFTKMKKCGIDKVDCNDPGNMYYFIEQVVDGKTKKLTWGGTNQKPPQDVKDLHGELMRMVRDLGDPSATKPDNGSKK